MSTTKIECPNCHQDGYLQILEEHTLSWNVTVEGDALVNETGYEDTDSPGTNERMFCGNCSNEFPMLDGVKVDYR